MPYFVAVKTIIHTPKPSINKFALVITTGVYLLLSAIGFANPVHTNPVHTNPAHTDSANTHNASTINTSPIAPFSARYRAKWNNISLRGQATRQLEISNDQQTTFRFEAKTIAAKVSENSNFNWQGCIPHPHTYSYERKGLAKRKKHLNQSFDWDKQKVISRFKKDQVEIPLQDGVMDKLSYQLAIRCDLLKGQQTLNYKVMDRSRIKHYQFKVVGEEALDSPIGPLETVKVERIRDNERRQTFLWFAKNLDYLLVKLEQKDTGGNHYQIDITSLKPMPTTANVQISQ